MVLYPHSVLLLDEIEKAHSQVKHLFLQVFDEGYLKDNHQHHISFKDTIIIMTSNATKQNEFFVGFKKQKFHYKDLEDYFSVEFLNRIDEIFSFRSLGLQDYQKILQKESPVPLSDDMIKDILQDYDYSLGTRPLLMKMKKYIVTHS